MKITVRTITVCVAVSFALLYAGCRDSRAAGTENKAEKPEATSEIAAGTAEEDIIAADDDTPAATSENSVQKKAVEQEAGAEGKKTVFTLKTRSRVDESNENRMKDKMFMKGSSTDKFLVFADDYDFIVIMQSPFSYKDTEIKHSFTDVKSLTVKISNKSKPSETPYVYEIKFPGWTKKQIITTLVLKDGRIELTIPRDEFNEELDVRRHRGY